MNANVKTQGFTTKNSDKTVMIGYWSYDIESNLITPDLQTKLILELDVDQERFTIDELTRFLLANPWENEEFSQKNYFHYIESLTTTNSGREKFLRKYVYATYEHDAITGYSGYVQDITEEYNQNTDPLKNVSRLENLLSNAYDIIIQVTPDLHITHNSESFADNPNAPSHISEYIHPDDMSKILSFINDMANESILIRTLRKEGYRWFRWHISPVVDGKGNVKFYNGIGHDVHKKTLAELKLNYQYELLTQTMESAQIGVYEYNILTDELSPTPVWRKMMGYKDGETVDRLAFYKKILPAKEFEKYNRMFDVCLTGTNDKYNIEYEFIDNDGNKIYIKDEGHPVEYKAGNPSRILGLCLNITERRQAEHLLEYKLNHDHLTGLANRNMLHTFISESMDLASRDFVATGIFLDLDNFKMVNDMYGHDAGDTCIKLVAEILKKHSPKSSIIARLSGDEFFLFIENTCDRDEIIKMTNEIINDIASNASPSDKVEMQVHASAGIAFYPSQAKDRRHLLSFADMAMYYSKTNGKNQLTVYSDDIGKSTMQNYSYAIEMTKAIQNNEFVLHYQPVVNVVTNEITSVEALVRWQHPTRGLLMPSAFISIAEFNGIIQKLGQWTIKTAVDQLSKWRGTNLDNIPISVNVSALELSGLKLGDFVVELLDQYNLPGSLLQIELMDNDKIESNITIKSNLTVMRKRGCVISVDNFGMDYASLSMLNNMDFDVIKLDKYFSDNLNDERLNLMLMGLIQNICKEYGKSCVVVGVEDQNQLLALKDMGFNYLQGYHLAMPMNEEELSKFKNNL